MFVELRRTTGVRYECRQEISDKELVDRRVVHRIVVTGLLGSVHNFGFELAWKHLLTLATQRFTRYYGRESVVSEFAVAEMPASQRPATEDRLSVAGLCEAGKTEILPKAGRPEWLGLNWTNKGFKV